MKSILKLMMLCIALHTSLANAVTGNDYMKFKSDSQLAYVIGVTETFLEIGMPMCIPGAVTYEQITAIFNKYLKEHPQDWHLSAPSLVLFSIKDSYTCETKDKKTTIEQKF